MRSKGKHLTVAGTVRVNGAVVNPLGSAHRKSVAYVMQEDALFATQTPREAILFSAALRLGKASTAAERVQLTEDMLSQLGLEKCADTLVGNIMIKGISGGEKKRTAIAVELVGQPRCVFLDEPTSGLDSFAAFNVVKVLKALSSKDRIVICTIHQPSSAPDFSSNTPPTAAPPP